MKAAKARQAEDDAVIQSLMSSVAGRQWMHDMLQSCHVFGSSFTGEAMGTAFREGERNIGLILLTAIMRAHPDAYVQMMKEQNDGGRQPTLDRRDIDDERNYDESGRWIGDGEQPK